jgi:hypothetical protein
MWIDGVRQNTRGVDQTSGGQNEKLQLAVGSLTDNTLAFGGDMLWFALHNRHLRPEEMRAFHAEPYSMFASGGPGVGASPARRLVDSSLASDTPLVGALA